MRQDARAGALDARRRGQLGTGSAACSRSLKRRRTDAAEAVERDGSESGDGAVSWQPFVVKEGEQATTNLSVAVDVTGEGRGGGARERRDGERL